MSEDPATPTIGITVPTRVAGLQQWQARRVTQAYRAALETHGAQVVELVPGEASATLDGLDGLLVTGGGDVAPDLYGQAPHPKLGPVDRVRDEFELALMRAAVARGLPVLGICRGAQVMGVALGGELIQDIPSQVSGAEAHQSSAKQPPARHVVRVAEGSLLSRIAGARSLLVNSYHHQATARLSNGLRPVAWSSDGLVEAVELAGSSFVLGVQWHPERMWRRAPRQRRLFSAFVSEAARPRGNNCL